MSEPTRDPWIDPAIRDLIAEGLAEIPLSTEPSRVETLAQLSGLVARWGRSTNLSGHRSPDGVARELVLDAAALLASLPRFGDFADLGSGAGFPGLPLAILEPGRRLTSVEARRKRVYFQRSAVRELGLDNVEVLLGRAEALEPRPASMVVAQAMAAPQQVLEWMIPWCEVGGLLVIPGSDRQPPDLAADPRAADPQLLEYRVPLGGRSRTLWCARRAR